MPMTQINFVEQLNRLINKALANVNNPIGAGSPITTATIGAALTNAATEVEALTGPPTTHSREVADPGPALNPYQPRTAT